VEFGSKMAQSRTLEAAVLQLLIVLMLAAPGCHSPRYAQRAQPSAANASVAPPVATSLEDIDAQNRAFIATQLGRPVAPGPATPEEVVAMSRSGVDPQFIISYINRSTCMTPISAADVVYLHEQGVNDQVIQAMLTPGNAYSRAEVARAMPPRVYIIEDPWAYYRYPYYGDPYYPHYGVAFGYGGRCY
jgi:hypothetical protein